jgi:putative transposase
MPRTRKPLGGELTHHLGYPPGGEKPPDTTNQRNGTSGKTVLTDDGPLTLDIPRDRDGTFEPQLIGKHERRFTGFDDRILALYARGLTVREIQAFLVEMYAVEVSPDFISTVTDAVHEEVTAWQSRPLEPMYPVVVFDALRPQGPAPLRSLRFLRCSVSRIRCLRPLPPPRPPSPPSSSSSVMLDLRCS